jgi:hypothetical protein
MPSGQNLKRPELSALLMPTPVTQVGNFRIRQQCHNEAAGWTRAGLTGTPVNEQSFAGDVLAVY